MKIKAAIIGTGIGLNILKLLNIIKIQMLKLYVKQIKKDSVF